MPSDPEATSRWLNDIRHHIAVAQTFVAGMSYDAFRDDLRTTYAVTRCLEIISEASRRLPDELKARHPGAKRRIDRVITSAHDHGWGRREGLRRRGGRRQETTV